MAYVYIPESAIWVDKVRMLQTTDPVLGGKDGASNWATQDITNRTVWLKQESDRFKNRIPIAQEDQFLIGLENGNYELIIAENMRHKLGLGDAAVVNLVHTKGSSKELAASQYLVSQSMASLPISSGYDPARQYETGDFVKINGEWYECYHPQGCIGIDPTDVKNRPAGWANPDIHAPYYWVKIGRALSLPEIGSPIPLATLSIREGLIKYRNDGQLSALKFWRLAELYPNLVKNGMVEIADLRAMIIRALDDGRGIDIGRVINSYQEDAMQNITGSVSQIQFVISQAATGVLSAYANPNIGGFYQVGLPSEGYHSTGGINFNASYQARTAYEERVKNIAMLYACRI